MFYRKGLAGHLNRQWLFLLGGLILSFAAIYYLAVLSPARLAGTVTINGAARQFRGLPLLLQAGNQTVQVSFQLPAPPFRIDKYYVWADDCVTRLAVNGAEIQGGIPFCDFRRGKSINLSGELRPSGNRIEMNMKNMGGPGGFDFRPAHENYAIATLRALLLLGIGAMLLSLRALWPRGPDVFALAILWAGVSLRLLYFFATPYFVREHDLEGHLQYVDYVTLHFRVPFAKDGWMFYQPPLYYFICALVRKAGAALGRPYNALGEDLQLLTLFISLGSLFAAAWISQLSFRSEQRKFEKWLVLSVFAVMPGVILHSGRINNDALCLFLVLLAFALLLRWWLDGRLGDWCTAMIILGLGLLTKTNSAILLPLPFALLLLKRGLRVRRKLILAVLMAVIIAAICSSYAYRRLALEKEAQVIGNTANMNAELYLPNNCSSCLLAFNPLRILAHPYNNPWNDSAGRRYLWEYVFRSSFTGEFNFSPRLQRLLSLLHLFAMAAGLFSFAGAVTAVGKDLRSSLPMLLFLASTLAFFALNRVFHPFSTSQDFRYIPFVVIPLAFFSARAAQNLPVVAKLILAPFLVLLGVFVIAVCFQDMLFPRTG